MACKYPHDMEKGKYYFLISIERKMQETYIEIQIASQCDQSSENYNLIIIYLERVTTQIHKNDISPSPP